MKSFENLFRNSETLALYPAKYAQHSLKKLSLQPGVRRLRLPVSALTDPHLDWRAHFLSVLMFFILFLGTDGFYTFYWWR